MSLATSWLHFVQKLGMQGQFLLPSQTQHTPASQPAFCRPGEGRLSRDRLSTLGYVKFITTSTSVSLDGNKKFDLQHERIN